MRKFVNGREQIRKFENDRKIRKCENVRKIAKNNIQGRGDTRVARTAF